MKFTTFTLLIILSVAEKSCGLKSPRKPPQNLWLKPASCGKSTMQGTWRIISGTLPTAGQWPWQVGLSFLDEHICGGTLINDDTLLTAAHCFNFFGANQVELWSVIVGDLNYLNPNKRYLVKSIVTHKDWKEFESFDIAVVKLAEKVVFDNDKSPACLPESVSDPAIGTPCYISGYGTTDPDAWLPNDRLWYADVNVVKNIACEKFFGAAASASATTICAGGGSMKNTCSGDSGGPFVCKVGDKWYLHGIVSYGGKPCGIVGKPSVYTRVSAYLQWIKDNS